MNINTMECIARNTKGMQESIGRGKTMTPEDHKEEARTLLYGITYRLAVGRKPLSYPGAQE